MCRDIETMHHHPPLAQGLMHMHMLAAHCAYLRTDLHGTGPKWLQYCVTYIYGD